MNTWLSALAFLLLVHWSVQEDATEGDDGEKKENEEKRFQDLLVQAASKYMLAMDNKNCICRRTALTFVDSIKDGFGLKDAVHTALNKYAELQSDFPEYNHDDKACKAAVDLVYREFRDFVEQEDQIVLSASKAYFEAAQEEDPCAFAGAAFVEVIKNEGSFTDGYRAAMRAYGKKLIDVGTTGYTNAEACQAGAKIIIETMGADIINYMGAQPGAKEEL